MTNDFDVFPWNYSVQEDNPGICSDTGKYTEHFKNFKTVAYQYKAFYKTNEQCHIF